MKQIPSFPKYSISKDGLSVKNNRTGKCRQQQTDKDGYKTIVLRGENQKQFFRRVHRLVAETYILNPEGKPHINHIDGAKDNNKMSNLEWCTASENELHAWRTGLKESTRQKLIDIGKAKPKETLSSMGKANRKLSDDDVRNIRHLANNGKSYKELALQYNYDTSSIGKIVRRQRYSDIE